MDVDWRKELTELKKTNYNFPWITAEITPALNRLVYGMEEITLKKGEILYDAGYESPYVFCLKSGRVINYIITWEGNQIILGIFTEGTLLGEAGIFDQQTDECIAQVSSPKAVLWRIPKAVFLQRIQSDGEIMSIINRSFVTKMRLLSAHLECVLFKSTVRKVAYMILSTAKYFGKVQEGGIFLDMRFTHVETSSTLGVSRVSVTNSFLQLAEWGYIKKIPKGYVVTNVAALRCLVEKGDEENKFSDL